MTGRVSSAQLELGERSEREGGKSKSKKIGLCRFFFQMFARVALRSASEAGVARLGTSDEPLNAV